jgi:hypothetical protein
MHFASRDACALHIEAESQIVLACVREPSYAADDLDVETLAFHGKARVEGVMNPNERQRKTQKQRNQPSRAT